ncbi:uncharacterized protein [Notamacropus eugenii]|uniref:uncharacterized protein n=1 Tax=Notamacropus eugenii TaxID=9315 RepID=UPI003B6790D2
MKRRDSGSDTGERRKCMEEKLNQSENKETGKAFQDHNYPPSPFDILDALLMEYLEENKEEDQSQVTVNSMSLPASSLRAINGEQKIGGKVNTCFPEELNSEEEKTKSSGGPGHNLAENTCRSGTFQPAIPEPCSLPLSRDPHQSLMTSLTEVPEYQAREQEAELKRRKEESNDKKHPRENEFQDLDVNISKKIALSNTHNKDISEEETEKVTSAMSKSLLQNYSQSENQEKEGEFHINNHSLKSFDTFYSLWKAYMEENKEEKQSQMARNSRSQLSPFLFVKNEEQKLDEKVHISFQKEHNPDGEKTRSSESPGANLAENTCSSGTLQPNTPDSMVLPPFWKSLLPMKTSPLMKLPEEQQKEQKSQPQSKKKEAVDKSADGNPFPVLNNSSPYKKLFQSLGDTTQLDALMRGEIVLNIDETDFLPHSPALNKPTNEGEKQNAENMEASDDQKEMKVRHKFSEYQLGILTEHFHRNEYVHPDEVQVLSKTLSLTPQQIQHWFQNQRYKKNKCSGPLKEAFNIQTADGVPNRNMNNSTPQKGIFQNLEELDGLKGEDVILNPEEHCKKMDFLPQTPALNKSKNEDKEEKAKNIEASDNQKGKKIRRKLSGYQQQILSVYFHRNEYIRPEEVEVLSEALSLTPQQIRFWFGNQRSKKKKFGSSFNRT